MAGTRQRRDTSQPADPMMAAAAAAVAAQEAATPAPEPAKPSEPTPVTPTTPAAVAHAPTGSLVSKIAAIALSIGDQAKDSFNKDQKFHYFSAEVVYGWWRVALQTAGIIIIPRLVNQQFHGGLKYKSGGEHMITVLNYEFTFTDGKESVVFGPVQGQGDDTSDKGSGKAMTYALKTLLLTMGMNASETDDNENDAHSQAAAQQDRADVKVEGSNIEGIQRGGRSTNANQAQINSLRNIYQKKALTFEDAQDVVRDLFGEALELDTSDGAPNPGAQLLAYFQSLSSEDIGKVIVEFGKFDDPNTAPDDGGFPS